MNTPCVRALTAEVLAVGPFHPTLTDHLEYPAQYYAQTRAGAVVITQVLSLDPHAQQEALAAALGVVVNDLSTHAIGERAINVGALTLLAEDHEVEAFLRLRDAGFRFYFWSEDLRRGDV